MADEVNYVLEAFKFMLLGMGIVFLFLFILVQVVELQAKIIAKYFPEDTSKTPAAQASANAAEDEQRKVAAIIAAVTEFRNNKS